MSGTKEGGRRAAETAKKRYGADYHKRVGGHGHTKTGGFASKNIGVDGLTGIERAKKLGSESGNKNVIPETESGVESQTADRPREDQEES